MVTEAHVKLRRTGSGKARTDSSAAGKAVHEVAASSQSIGQHSRGAAVRDLRRKRSIWPLAHGRPLPLWAVGALLAACTITVAVCLTYLVVPDTFSGALLLTQCFLQSSSSSAYCQWLQIASDIAASASLCNYDFVALVSCAITEAASCASALHSAEALCRDGRGQAGCLLDARQAAPAAAVSDLPPDHTPASARNGTRTAGPARGVFPAGCRWRTVKYNGEAKRPFWAVEEYEWWDAASGSWGAQQPAACLVPGKLQRRGCGAGHMLIHRRNKLLL